MSAGTIVPPNRITSGREKCLRTFTASEAPVTIPRRAATCCRKISMIVLKVMTQSSA